MESGVSSFAEYSRLEILGISAFLAFFAICILYLIYFIFYSLIRLIIRQPIIGSIIIGVILLLAGFGVYVYLTDLNDKKFSDSLFLIQDNLAEATVAKIMGDSLVEKKPLVTASWQRVGIETQMVSGRLKDLSVPKELESYKEAAVDWVNEVGIASLDPKVWGDVRDDPGDFKLKLSDRKAKQLFEHSVQKISELKEFGDGAIQMKNQVSMLYVGAKLRVERHWLNGITHSEKAGFFSFDFIPSAFAALPPVPDIGPGMDVTCQVCSDPTVKMTDYQRRMYNCDTRCKPSGQQTQTNNQQQNQTNQQKQNTGGNVSGGGTTGGTTGGTSNQPPARKICIGRGGISTGSGGPTNVYCVEEIMQSTNGIDASAIGFAKGEKNSGKDWENGWHNLEGMGVIYIGEPSSSGHSPTVQKFYDDCVAKGGTVGGAGLAKSRLPTAEFGYTCDYKIGNNNTQCWDFLTYSGGRYMGGESGCTEKNLLPSTAELQAEGEAGGQWDGHYTGTLTGNCVTTVPGRPTYSDTFGLDFTVINNVTFDSTVNTYVAIDDSGAAIESFQMSMPVEGGTAYASAIFYFAFSEQDGGAAFSGSGSMDAVGYATDGTVNYMSCTLTGSGTRQ
ncbi:hypothetical protein HZB93_00100 [Candidatus Falkowbacteria bacterium]|nr:hypothetical protein [Candidatus Falkowbacteria bacterium]